MKDTIYPKNLLPSTLRDIAKYEEQEMVNRQHLRRLALKASRKDSK